MNESNKLKSRKEVTPSLRDRVYYAARDGMAITMYALLSENRAIAEDLLSQVPSFVLPILDFCIIFLDSASYYDACTAVGASFLAEHFVDDSNQRCTPLIIAAKNGHDKVVKTLLANFNLNLEQEGTIKFDTFVVEGASALWVAAGAGYLNVVKVLVKSGAQVNHPTRTNSTPLRAACFDGRLDIVKYLTDHNANIHIANNYNNTCLMIAAYKGHLDIVSFLLEKGADPDERANCGATALHFAAECGHTAIVKELLKYGAAFVKNENDMTPLTAAAVATKANVVEYLITLHSITKQEKIEALELLGASFANDKDNYCLEKAYYYLHSAMELRYSDPNDIVKKPPCKPIPAYENCIECQTLQDLEAIKRNQNALHMESLSIRERILGRHNPEVPHPVIYRGAVFADNARFDRCIELWIHALNLKQLNHVTVTKDLLRFAQVFSQMLHAGVGILFEHVKAVLAAAIAELTRSKEKIESPSPKDDVEQIAEGLEYNINTVLYVLVIVTKLMKKDMTSADKFEIHQLVYKLNKLNVTTRDRQSLLHLCVNFQTPVDDFHTNDVCKFPCAEVARLLIRCGADVNCMDLERNTPLHIIVSYQKPVSDFMTLHSIILDLIEAGAHMDTVNALGKTPFEAATTGVAEIILRTQSKISLKCMAARVVKSYDLTYQGQVPKPLESFIELHGP